MRLVIILFIILISSVYQKAQTSFVINSDEKWQSTNLDVSEDDKLLIISYGIWNYGGDDSSPGAWKRPDGSSQGSAGAGFLAPELSSYTLAGKFGENGTPFSIGSYSLFSAKESGVLYLAVNDDHFWYNSGYLVAVITINI